MSHIRSTDYKKGEIDLAVLAKALAHPARVAILNFLSSKDACFCGDIVQELPIAQATVSQHLKELKAAGLIQGSIEPPKVRYCIDPEKWEEAQELFSGFWMKNRVANITDCSVEPLPLQRYPSRQKNIQSKKRIKETKS
jgi:ArsR family transcriptional regulator, arsenate/arsenite/antimonite-responsive transcriptional repressor